MSTPAPVVQVRNLVKTFGRTRALDGLDLTVSAGEVHGFLGPNGAGKSTTIRALLGLLRTDSGSMSVFGCDPWAEVVATHRPAGLRARRCRAVAESIRRGDH